ncbi:unnamed protein product [Sphagnum jensenii]|uniref:Mini-chromosome maintenance complex-binding protein n=1 Tax=Sphagnum jensenii TaxID=128206 RepID=A0ABP0W443_9BRYO
MGGPPVDCFRNPAGAVRVLFDKACRAATSPADFTRSDWGVKELFESYLFGRNVHCKVPEINSVQLDSLPVNSLVRFRGMVQDMFDVEYYIGAYKEGGDWHTTKYMDVADVPTGQDTEPQMWDRRLLYCVPVPGENEWVKEAFSPTDGLGATAAIRPLVAVQGEKRPRDAEGAEDMDATMACADELIDNKRMREDASSSATSTSQEVAAAAVHTLDLNMPLNAVGGNKLVPCLVKVYDGLDADIKLNDIVEFFGVLTFDPELSAVGFPQANGANIDAEFESAFIEDHVSVLLPASKVPRLQCITLRKISQQTLISTLPTLHPGVPVPLPAIEQIRQSLLDCLRNVIGGDSLAAEYMLLHLLSQVHTRVDSMALGKLSLNLTGCNPGVQGAPSPLAVSASNTIAKLLPRSHLMPLSLHSLNLASIAPRKDYAANRLMTGMLQLAEGTHLTLDETALEAGTLNATGIQNLASLKHLLEWQKVEYDFQFYKMEMPADLPVLILSQAKSRMLPADAVVPLMSTATPACSTPDELDFAKWRLYLTMARDMEHTLQPSILKTVEDDLVAARQEDRTLGPETFHRWLTMARLMAVSYMEPTLLPERWRMVRDLEFRCAERLRCC